MAATLASMCSVPLTSVLLLFELTRDYRILLPLMGVVGLAIWVPSVTTQTKDSEASDTKGLPRGYTVLSPVEDKNEEDFWRQTGEGKDFELSVIGNSSNYQMGAYILLEDLKVSQAMSSNYLKNCILIVDADDYLEGILTYSDIRRSLYENPGHASNGDTSNPDVNTCTNSSVCTRGISYRGREHGLLICYPDTDLVITKQLMEAKGIKQLPVVKRGYSLRERKRRVVAVLYYDSIWNFLRDELNHQTTVYQQSKEETQREGDCKWPVITR